MTATTQRHSDSSVPPAVPPHRQDTELRRRGPSLLQPPNRALPVVSSRLSFAVPATNPQAASRGSRPTTLTTVPPNDPPQVSPSGPGSHHLSPRAYHHVQPGHSSLSSRSSTRPGLVDAPQTSSPENIDVVTTSPLPLEPSSPRPVFQRMGHSRRHKEELDGEIRPMSTTHDRMGPRRRSGNAWLPSTTEQQTRSSAYQPGTISANRPDPTGHASTVLHQTHEHHRSLPAP